MRPQDVPPGAVCVMVGRTLVDWRLCGQTPPPECAICDCALCKQLVTLTPKGAAEFAEATGRKYVVCPGCANSVAEINPRTVLADVGPEARAAMERNPRAKRHFEDFTRNMKKEGV